MNARRLSVALLFLLARAVFAAEPVEYGKVPLPTGVVAADAKVIPGAVVCFLEGPAVDAEGNVFFSDIAGNRILKMDPAGKVSVFRANSGRTNGNCFDAQGRLVSCEGGEQGPGRRRIVRTDMKSGELTVLSDKFEGKRYNSPNDVCIDTKGRIWFTDPRYGDRSDLELDVEAVYRIDPDGKVARVLNPPAVQKPNGIAISPDDKTLYVIDSNPVIGGNRKIWAFDVTADGKPEKQRLVYDFGKGRGGRRPAAGHEWQPVGRGRDLLQTQRGRDHRRPAGHLCHHAAGQTAGSNPDRRGPAHQPGLRRPGPEDAVRYCGENAVQAAGQCLGICAVSTVEIEVSLTKKPQAASRGLRFRVRLSEPFTAVRAAPPGACRTSPAATSDTA